MSLVALLTRSVISLAIVFAIVFVAYRIAKRRASGASSRVSRPSTKAGGRTSSLFGGHRRSTPAPIEVVGRVGLTRGAAAVAIRFGDRIVLVSATDQGQATVLAEMPGAQWEELTAVAEVATPISAIPDVRTGAMTSTARPGFVEALRQATSRHA